ncbi:MAG: pyridoxal-phosphate dependent enzyme, partial [Actinomycetota bacterium]
PHVIAGQATVAQEFLEQVPGLTQLVVPIGGGGLASGIVVATSSASVQVLGVQPSSNAAMVSALTGVPFIDGATAADGLAGDVERGSVTIDLLREAGVEVVTVAESAIARAVVLAFSELGLVLEASGAVGLAALSEGFVPKSTQTGVLLTGRNVSVERYRELLSGGTQAL